MPTFKDIKMFLTTIMSFAGQYEYIKAGVNHKKM